MNNSVRVTEPIVRIQLNLIQTNVIRRVVGFGDGGGAGRDPDAANGAAGGQVGARGGPLEVGEGLRRRRRVGGGRGRTASFEVELEEVEEGAGDERAPDEASSALDHSLEWHYQPHGGGSGRYFGSDSVRGDGMDAWASGCPWDWIWLVRW